LAWNGVEVATVAYNPCRAKWINKQQTDATPYICPPCVQKSEEERDR